MLIYIPIFLIFIPKILTENIISLPFEYHSFNKNSKNKTDIIGELSFSQIVIPIIIGSNEQEFLISITLQSYYTIIMGNEFKNDNWEIAKNLQPLYEKSRSDTYIKIKEVKELSESVVTEGIFCNDIFNFKNNNIGKLNFLIGTSQQGEYGAIDYFYLINFYYFS